MKYFLSTLFLMLLVVAVNAQANRYVSTTGSDTNPGTLAAPWKTIQFALNSAAINTIIHVRGGTYFENLNATKSGSSNGYITLQNYAGETVILDGTGTTGTVMLRIHNRNYIRIKGLTIRNLQKLDAQGILISGKSNRIEILDCKVTNINFSTNPNTPASPTRNSQPIIVYGTDPTTPVRNLLISGNEVYSNRTGYSEALAVNGNVSGFTVSNNIVHDNTNIGIDIIGHEGSCPTPALDQARNGVISGNLCYNNKSPYANAGGIYVDGGRDLVIESNTCYQNQYGIEIGAENVGKKTTKVIVRNNFVYNNDFAGLVIGGYNYPTQSGKVDSCSITHNTFLRNDRLNDYTGEITFAYTEQCKLSHNIFYARRRVMFYMDAGSIGLQSNYNCWFGTGTANTAEFDWAGAGVYTGISAYQSATGQDLNSFFGNPQLANISFTAPDIHLLNNSPCVDAGNSSFNPSASELDYYGLPRKIGPKVDMGANEFALPPTREMILTSERNSSTNFDMIQIFPNPASTRIFIPSDFLVGFDKGIIQVWAINGIFRRIYSTNDLKGNELDISTFPSGVYGVQFISAEGKLISTSKLVVK